MNFETWEPVYETVLADMGYARAEDERARDLLARLTAEGATLDPPAEAMAGEAVAIAAPGPSLLEETAAITRADVVVAAGRAADRLVDAGVDVDWVVTDLDDHAERVPAFTTAGVSVAIHAHGDNRERLSAVLRNCDRSSVLPTTQAAPVGRVRNYGGFTDGDRAAFLADALGARSLSFPGWDLADTAVGAEKARKLTWAARLLYWLETRRDESFDVLEDLRADLDVSMVPVEG